MTWAPSTFLIAHAAGPFDVTGYVYRGLGLHMAVKASPKGRRPPKWALTHLGSGHRLVFITGAVADAFPVATEIAECGDWSFDGLYGWKNMDPELPAKFRAIVAKHPNATEREGARNANEEAARKVVEARLA